jgi:hypothetical protein
MGKLKMLTDVWSESVKGRENLVDTDVDGKTTVKLILRKRCENLYWIQGAGDRDL